MDNDGYNRAIDFIAEMALDQLNGNHEHAIDALCDAAALIASENGIKSLSGADARIARSLSIYSGGETGPIQSAIN